jgi:Glycosyl transferase family 2
MKITGFTFIRNAIKFDFPVVEAIQSILPICDEFVVAVGDSEDGTLALIQNIGSEKIKIVQTNWDMSANNLKCNVFAQETDKAMAAISDDTDWCFYIQSDELVHEKYLETIREAMLEHQHNPEVDGLLLHYKHFFGSYDFVGASLRWYRKEIRIIRKRADIYSYKDAQSFRKKEDKKLKVKQIDAEMYHYGYVREPKSFAEKLNLQDKLYHGATAKQRSEAFDFSKEADAVYRFEGTHPAVMQVRIARKNWDFDFDPSQNRFRLKDRIKIFIEKITGYRIGEFKNYELI